MQSFEQYWVFAVFCLLVAVLLVRLILHERITLQNSLLFFAFLAVVAVIALRPGWALQLAARMGFVLPSNFLFAVSIGALVLLNVSTLVTLSRVELRSVALTQELAILREQLDRMTTRSHASVQAEARKDVDGSLRDCASTGART